jgi:Uma2 family endonuclease
MFDLTTATIPKTPMDIYRSLPEGTRAEIIDNVIYTPPSPFEVHQKISGVLSGEIYLYFKQNNSQGRFYTAPFDVFLDEHTTSVQPDILILLPENPVKIESRGHLHGVPDIVIELLSQGNKDYDLIRKKDLYERYGVREYFVVEPESGLTFHYYLQDGVYVLAKEEIRKLASRLLNHVFEW